MKDYKEMARCVLEARDEHLRRKKRRQAVLRRGTPAVLSLCCVIAVLSVQRDVKIPPAIPETAQISENVSSTQTAEASTASSTIHSSETSVITASSASETKVVTETNVTETIAENITAETSMAEQTEEYTQTNVNTSTPVIETTASVEITCEQTTTTSDNYTMSPPDEVTPIGTPPVPWNERTLSQQFNIAEFGSPLKFYQNADKTVSKDEIGEFLDSAYMSGYDDVSDTYYHCICEAYTIRDLGEKEMIAIKFENNSNYYVYSYSVPDESE